VTSAQPPGTGVLEGPFAAPPVGELRPLPATVDLVKSQVQALLLSTPSYHALEAPAQAELSDNLIRISAYAAECMRDVYWQSKRLGQTPIVRRRESVGPATSEPTHAPLASAQASNFEPRAASQVARITRETLKAVAFPAFVADLIRGTFDAITRTNDHQMQAFMELIRNVGKSVDDFMEDNISDAQASDWLAQKYPEHISIQGGRAVARPQTREGSSPNFTRELNLPGSVDLDESSIDEVLVPAARRRLAETRLQMLSTMVLMGMNRIVVTGGKIRATMGFHIDTTDRAREEHATDLDLRFAAQGGVNFAFWSASASTSIAYVSSSRLSSDSEINVDTDLTGEVELHFKSDYFPIQRFAGGGTLNAIRANTPVPAENVPVGADGSPIPAGPAPGPPPGGDGAAYRSPRSRRTERPASTLPPLGQIPERRMPVAPDPVQPVQRRGGAEGDQGGHGATGEEGAPPAEGEDSGAGASGGEHGDAGSAHGEQGAGHGAQSGGGAGGNQRAGGERGATRNQRAGGDTGGGQQGAHSETTPGEDAAGEHAEGGATEGATHGSEEHGQAPGANSNRGSGGRQKSGAAKDSKTPAPAKSPEAHATEILQWSP